MNKSLEIAKTELEWLKQKYKASSDFRKNKYQEILEYTMQGSRKRLTLKLSLIYMHNENALGFNYEFIVKDKDEEHSEKHSFADVLKDIKLPAIDDEDITRLKDNIKFELIEGKITSSISPTTQAVTYTEIVKRNIDNLFEYGKSLIK